MELTLAEKITLLAVDDETGKLRPLPDRALEFALAGALLADLAVQERIYARSDKVEILSTEPVGEPMQDRALERIAECRESGMESWISVLANEGSQYKSMTLDALVEKKILTRQDDRFFWFFHTCRYPSVNLKEESAVIERVRKIVIDESVEATRADNVLISLINICQLSTIIFTRTELEEHSERIRDICKRDYISRTVTETIQEIQRALLEIRAYSGM